MELKLPLVTAALGLGLFSATPVYALNYFDLSVYGYKTLEKGERLIENKANYTFEGTDDAPAPDNNEDLLRNSVELAYGITGRTEIAGYLDFAKPEDNGWSHAEDRLRVRTRLFEKGQLPVDLGLYAELEFPRHEENDVELELRGVIEKDFGKWALDINPIFTKVVAGQDTAEGWELQHASSLIYHANERWHPRLDLFGDFGLINDFSDTDEQIHLISPAVDIELGKGFAVGVGVAFGLTDASEQQLLRTKLEWEF